MGPRPPKFLENIVILCFERRFSKQNSVIRLKSNIVPPKKFLGWLRQCFPVPVVAGNREDKSTHAKFFCNQAQTY